MSRALVLPFERPTASHRAHRTGHYCKEGQEGVGARVLHNHDRKLRYNNEHYTPILMPLMP